MSQPQSKPPEPPVRTGPSQTRTLGRTEDFQFRTLAIRFEPDLPTPPAPPEPKPKEKEERDDSALRAAENSLVGSPESLAVVYTIYVVRTNAPKMALTGTVHMDYILGSDLLAVASETAQTLLNQNMGARLKRTLDKLIREAGTSAVQIAPPAMLPMRPGLTMEMPANLPSDGSPPGG